MRNARLREPISDDTPSGPDLDETADQAYGEYLMLAGGRLPERFFSKEGNGSNRDVPFDRSRIDADAESQAINALLQRTRDVRLLILEARFHALSGSFRDFADTLHDLAELVDVFWDSIHPAPEGDDFSRRINAFEELESQVHVILPLTFTPLVGTGGGGVTYRSYMLATEKVRPRDEEPVPSLDSVMEALSSKRNIDQVAAVTKAVDDARNNLDAIRNIFISRSGPGSAPSFERQVKLFSEIGALLAEAQPDVAAPAAAVSGDSQAVAAQDSRPTIGAVKISTQQEASAALIAIEQYFQGREPSAPALILVHQARMLFGRPLVAALEALLPEMSASTALRFDGAGAFDIGFGQMRVVTDHAATADTAPIPDTEEEAPTVIFAAESRTDATSLMLGVEAFYRQVEPSSPIPMLLTKARGLLNKDFAALLSELLPRQAQ